jgi:hypothetical protein
MEQKYCLLCGQTMSYTDVKCNISELGFSIADGRVDVPREYWVRNWYCKDHGAIIERNQLKAGLVDEIVQSIPSYEVKLVLSEPELKLLRDTLVSYVGVDATKGHLFAKVCHVISLKIDEAVAARQDLQKI